jgi:predicted DNA binding CopG/RHH family protein
VTAKLKVPKFASEAEEAQWWYDHRDELTKAFENAAARGELRTGSAAKLGRERAVGITPTTTIRLDPEDIARARALAAKRGLRYQTYLKMLLHEALQAEEKNSPGESRPRDG